MRCIHRSYRRLRKRRSDKVAEDLLHRARAYRSSPMGDGPGLGVPDALILPTSLPATTRIRELDISLEVNQVREQLRADNWRVIRSHGRAEDDYSNYIDRKLAFRYPDATHNMGPFRLVLVLAAKMVNGAGQVRCQKYVNGQIEDPSRSRWYFCNRL